MMVRVMGVEVERYDVAVGENCQKRTQISGKNVIGEPAWVKPSPEGVGQSLAHLAYWPGDELVELTVNSA